MKNLKSFTLIELLVVIVIIGILSGLVVIATTSFVNSTSNAKLVAELSTMAKTLETQSSYPKGSFCLEDTAQSQDLLDTLGMTKPPRHPSYKQGDTSATTNECFLYFSDGEHYSIRVNSLGNKGILVQESRHMKTAGIKDKCEEGWIPFGNRCVMKYEAKAMTSSGSIVSDGCNGSACSVNTHTAVSKADGVPWRYISQTNAKKACEKIGAHLITNAEWMAIARDIEQVKENWTGGQVGSGILKRGNVGITDAGSYDGDNPETGILNDKAILKLSNGQEIYHLSGNVWEWVDDTIPLGNIPSQAGWTTYNTANASPSTYYNDYLPKSEVAPLGSYTENYAVGAIYYGSKNINPRPFLRGGFYSLGLVGGVFALWLNGPPTTHTGFGFRCAR